MKLTSSFSRAAITIALHTCGPAWTRAADTRTEGVHPNFLCFLHITPIPTVNAATLLDGIQRSGSLWGTRICFHHVETFISEPRADPISKLSAIFPCYIAMVVALPFRSFEAPLCSASWC